MSPGTAFGDGTLGRRKGIVKGQIEGKREVVRIRVLTHTHTQEKKNKKQHLSLVS